ncbi:MAG: DoxX family protein [Motilibacteraceae bacterium]|jgi:uncharacterized membrane protein YphA (DoxX/SURF4 family)|nr:DoxX family membrane protein [Motilibacteraceae bacterium]
MMLLRRAARPMLASMFLVGGLDAVRHPEGKAPAAERVKPLAEKIPQLPTDPVTLARINGGAMLAAGTLLSLGKLPRLSALVLAGTLVPTTFAGHPFWEEKDPAKRAQQRIHFFKNLSLFGGLVVAAADTAGKPGVTWRTKHAVHDAGRQAALLKAKSTAALPTALGAVASRAA